MIRVKERKSGWIEWAKKKGIGDDRFDYDIFCIAIPIVLSRMNGDQINARAASSNESCGMARAGGGGHLSVGCSW